MHPHILMELARIRSEALIDEARHTALVSQLRRQAGRRTDSSLAPAAQRCLLCGRSPCACAVVT